MFLFACQTLLSCYILKHISDYTGEQDLVFSVKLQFGKALVSVQNKFALQKDFLFRKFWTKNKYKFQEKFLGPKNLSLWKKMLFRIF